MFGRATIRLGIGPHSSLLCFCTQLILAVADSSSVLAVPVGCVIFSRLASPQCCTENMYYRVQEVADKLQPCAMPAK